MLGVIKIKNRKRSIYGGVLIEFALSIPLLAVFLVGIISSGRLFQQVATVGQAAFLGAQFGTQITNQSDLAQVPFQVERILNLQVKKPIIPLQFQCSDNMGRCNNGIFWNPSTTGEDAKTLRVKVNGVMEILYNSIDINLEVVAPILLIDQSGITNLNELDTPQNPSTLYNCIGGINNASCNCCSGTGAVRGDFCSNSC